MTVGIDTLSRRTFVALSVKGCITCETIVDKLGGIHELRHAGCRLPAYISVIGDLRLETFLGALTAFRSDDDNTGRGTATIDSC